MSSPLLVGDCRRITATMARELAVAERVCVRPLMRRVEDRQTGTDTTVAIPCGSTRESVCPPCAHKARVLRMQQCAEGWHRDHEPEPPDRRSTTRTATTTRTTTTRRFGGGSAGAVDPAPAGRPGSAPGAAGGPDGRPDVHCPRRHDLPALDVPHLDPAVLRADRARTGTPATQARYDYRRAALDALHFPKLVDRLWQNLRRCAGYRVQYFAAVEPQRRLAPHLHAAIRGAIPDHAPRSRQGHLRAGVVAAASTSPSTSTRRFPVWDGDGLHRPAHRGSAAHLGPGARPARRRPGCQAGACDAVRHAKPTCAASSPPPRRRPGRPLPHQIPHQIRRRHLRRPRRRNVGPGAAHRPAPRRAALPAVLARVRELAPLRRPTRTRRPRDAARLVRLESPRSGEPRPRRPPRPGLPPVVRQDLDRHRADRAAVVREALAEAGIVAPEIERLAADVLSADGQPRFVWTDTRPDPQLYARVILASIAERQRWRAQYEAAKAARQPVDSLSATGPAP